MTLFSSRVRWLALTVLVISGVLFIVNPNLMIQSQSQSTVTPTVKLPPPPPPPSAQALTPPPPCLDSPALASTISLTETYAASLTISDPKSGSKTAPISLQYPKGWIADGGGEKALSVASDKNAQQAGYYGKLLVRGQVYLQAFAFNLPADVKDATDIFSNQPADQYSAYSQPIILHLGGKTVGCAGMVGNGLNTANEGHAYTFSEQGNNFAIVAVTAKGDFENQRATIEAIVASVSSHGGDNLQKKPTQSATAELPPDAINEFERRFDPINVQNYTIKRVVGLADDIRVTATYSGGMSITTTVTIPGKTGQAYCAVVEPPVQIQYTGADLSPSLARLGQSLSGSVEVQLIKSNRFIVIKGLSGEPNPWRFIPGSVWDDFNVHSWNPTDWNALCGFNEGDTGYQVLPSRTPTPTPTSTYTRIPSATLTTTKTQTPTPTSIPPVSYQGADGALTFQYPANWSVDDKTDPTVILLKPPADENFVSFRVIYGAAQIAGIFGRKENNARREAIAINSQQLNPKNGIRSALTYFIMTITGGNDYKDAIRESTTGKHPLATLSIVRLDPLVDENLILVDLGNQDVALIDVMTKFDAVPNKYSAPYIRVAMQIADSLIASKPASQPATVTLQATASSTVLAPTATVSMTPSSQKRTATATPQLTTGETKVSATPSMTVALPSVNNIVSINLSQHYTARDNFFSFDYPATLQVDGQLNYPVLAPLNSSENYTLELFVGIKMIYSQYPNQEGCTINEAVVKASVTKALQTLIDCSASGADLSQIQPLTISGKPAASHLPLGLIMIDLGNGVPALLRQTVDPGTEQKYQPMLLAIAASIRLNSTVSGPSTTPANSTGSSQSTFSLSITKPDSEDQVIATDTIWILFGGQRNIVKPGKLVLNSPPFVARPLMLRYRWCANSEARRTEIVTPFSIKFYVDGVEIDPSQILVFDRLTQQKEYCRFYAVLLSNWPKGRQVNLQIVFTLTQAVNDGKTNFPAGTYETDITMNVKSETGAAPVPRTATPLPTAVTTKAAACPGSPAPRLVIGGQGHVLPGDPNNLNSKPSRPSLDSTSKKLGAIPAGGVFTVLDGPVCNQGITWWKVNYKGTEGWTGESDTKYWVEPIGKGQ